MPRNNHLNKVYTLQCEEKTSWAPPKAGRHQKSWAPPPKSGRHM